jgi:predicted lipoprotein with Yx(FWY)xxD motif
VFNPSLNLKLLAGSALAALVLAGCGGGSSTVASYRPPVQNPGSNGGPLNTAMLNGAPGFVNSAGFTVYVFDADLNSPGHSTCNGPCAQNWPPVAPPSGTLPSPWTSIARQDGSMQLAYAGRPLYTFALDTAPGQFNGDGVNAFGGVWHIARPQGSGSGGSGGGGGY